MVPIPQRGVCPGPSTLEAVLNAFLLWVHGQRCDFDSWNAAIPHGWELYPIQRHASLDLHTNDTSRFFTRGEQPGSCTIPFIVSIFYCSLVSNNTNPSKIQPVSFAIVYTSLVIMFRRGFGPLVFNNHPIPAI